MVGYLFLIEGMSYKQISEILDIPEANVPSFCARGKVKLMKIIRNEFPFLLKEYGLE